MTQVPGTIIKIFGGVLFIVILSALIWSIFFDKNASKPLTPDEQRKMEDVLKRQYNN